jgi:hypothetical protein
VPLDDVGGGDNFKQVWTMRIGEDHFELCCRPFSPTTWRSFVEFEDERIRADR